MANYQKLTVSLPVQLVQQLRHIAARRQTSVSRLIAETLVELAAREDNYARARDQHLAWLEHAADLGTEGHIDWSRDSLHER